jgi:hypothetical protein
MFFRFSIFLVFILFSSEIYSQKTIQKQWDQKAVDTVLIASDAVYNVRITSEETKTITLTTSVEGEIYESVVVEEVISGRTLQIDTGFSPFFSPKNDKLAAHKVLSVEMVLVIPNDVAVIIRSKNASVLAKGKMVFLETALERGHCILENFQGDARLFSIFGDIYVWAQTGVGGRASSEKGEVRNALKLQGDFFIEAESVNGSVSLVPMK